MVSDRISVLVDLVSRLGSNLPCLFPFYSFIIADIVPFIFSWILCRFFYFFDYDLSKLDSCCEELGIGWLFYFDLSNVYYCGTGRSHMDG